MTTSLAPPGAGTGGRRGDLRSWRFPGRLRSRSRRAAFGPRCAVRPPGWGPARRVVERVVETGSGRRCSGLSGVCTFAGSSSRNLRTRRATPANEREFGPCEQPGEHSTTAPMGASSRAPPPWHQGTHRWRGASERRPRHAIHRCAIDPVAGIGQPRTPPLCVLSREPARRRSGPVPVRPSDDPSRGYRLPGWLQPRAQLAVLLRYALDIAVGVTSRRAAETRSLAARRPVPTTGPCLRADRLALPPKWVYLAPSLGDILVR